MPKDRSTGARQAQIELIAKISNIRSKLNFITSGEDVTNEGKETLNHILNSELDTEKIYDAVTSDFLDHYATPDAGDGCGDISISPGNGNDKAEDGSFANSNQFASNDFYLILIY